MPHVTIEIDRGNGWQTRAAGETDATPDQMRAALVAYALQYPHRVMVGDLLLVAVPLHARLTEGQIMDCRGYAKEHGVGIEFLT